MASTVEPSGMDCARSEIEPLLGSSAEAQRGDGGRIEDDIRRPGETLRLAAATFSFILLGLVSSSVGVMIPQLEHYYRLNHTHVSLIFVTFPAGYLVAAYFNSFMHLKLGQRGVAIIGPLSHLVFTSIASLHPPFPVFLIASAIGAFGGGLMDGSWCAWTGGMDNVNTVQGILHGGFSTGAGLGPFLAGTLITKGHKPWYCWYYVLAGSSLVEAALLFYCFRFEGADRYLATKREESSTEEEEYDADRAERWAIFKHSVTWICSAYFLSYVGTETAVSGWIVEFMQDIRRADPYLASICSSLFWVGMTVGRLTLGFVTDRIGARLATLSYIIVAIVLQGFFAFVESPGISAAIIWFLGYFFGPMFPSGIVMVTRLLPKFLHIRAIALVVALGQVGGACIPFGLGALADLLGLKVFQFTVLAWLLVTLVAWLSFPRSSEPAHPSGDENTRDVQQD